MAARTTKPADAEKASDAAPEDAGDLYADKISFRDDKTVVEFRGRKFAFPTSRAEWPTRAFQAFQRQQHADGVELVLGPRQWAVLNQVAPRITDFWDFLPLFAAASGFVKLDDSSAEK